MSMTTNLIQTLRRVTKQRDALLKENAELRRKLGGFK